MNKETGGQAFPIPGSEHNYMGEGMTLRDYFAAMAMQSLTSVYWEVDSQYESGEALIKCQASTAYEMADAMLEARSK